jgi:hypothetical protein
MAKLKLSRHTSLSLSRTELLELVNSAGVLKATKSSTHDVTLDDLVHDTLSIINTLGEGEKWKSLAILVTGEEEISQREGSCDLVKEKCRDYRDR